MDAVGSEVTAWKVGDRVGVGWHGGHCFECDRCKRGDFLNCRSAKITGISHDGGYQEYMITPWEAVARIPEELAPEDAGPLLCAGITTYNALRNSGARPGDLVAIQGIGGLGHLGIQYASRMGFRTVALSRGESKKALALALGAHEYVDTAANKVDEALQALGGADVILATAANAPDAIAACFGGLAPRGTLMVVGATGEAIPIHGFGLLSGKSVRGWPSGTAADSEDTMKFSALTHIRPRIEKFPLEQAEEAFQKCMENKVRFRAVLTMT